MTDAEFFGTRWSVSETFTTIGSAIRDTMSPDQIAFLRDELTGNRLSVAKLPTSRGYVRLAVSQNCDWYREFCRRHLSIRRRFPKPRTVIRRAATLRALDRMSRGDFSGVYAARIVAVVNEVYA